MQDYEKLGVFYLGGEYNLAERKRREELLLYDSANLTTHAVCVGMTGSGKTGLCLALLEEAAIDGIPAIAIDPKGDLGNLLLAFPKLLPEDFRPWIDESQAARQGVSPDDLAKQTAERWRKGLADWDESPERIERFLNSADMAIYTPGSNAGLPLAVLRSFAAPPPAVLADDDALRERENAAVSALLALTGIVADPLRSREHILLVQLIDQAWRQGRGIEVADLIRGIQSPSVERIGYVDLESFFPAKERFELAMKLNNLLASPSFAPWMQGEPLEIARLLHTQQGKPRISILSIAHLSDPERMFFVTLLLGEVLSWMRTQPGTSSLRAILYMDEVFGYFPPSANPPAKIPMLTLLKQARAFGLGIVLATQNPVDLDYKGLSNAGTWFLGRLQTERDKARVLEGLEGASTAAGANFDRGKMEATLAGLGSRVFLMNSVHENQPVVFQSRWCLSYLRGPLSRQQIQTLMAPRKQAAAEAAQAPQRRPTPASAMGVPTTERPLVPSEIKEEFIQLANAKPAEKASTFRPALLGRVKLHYVDTKARLDHWQTDLCYLTFSADNETDPWADCECHPADSLESLDTPAAGSTFAPLPRAWSQPKYYSKFPKELAAHLYRGETLRLWRAADLGEISRAGESEGDFRVRLQHQARESRDADVQKIRQKYAPKIATLESQTRRAQDRIEREKSQFQNQALSALLSFGSSILRMLMGRKASSGLGGATSAARSASRAAGKKGTVDRAEEDLETLKDKRTDLEAQVQAEIDHLTAVSESIELVEYPVRPRKSDITVEGVWLAWVR